MPETHVESEEVRKLAERIVDGEGLPKEWWDERDDRKSKDIEIEWTAQLLCSALRANEERVRRETLEEAAQYVLAHDNLGTIAADEIRALAAQPAAGKEPSRD